IVQLSLHLSSKTRINNIWEVFIHDFIHSFAQPGSYKAPLLLITISPILNSADNGYIGTGTANTLLLKFFNQACFTQTRWWLSEMLLRCQSMQIQHFLHTKSWKIGRAHV